MKLATALTERADLQTRLSVMRDFLNNASQKIDRYSRAESYFCVHCGKKI